MAEEFKGDEEIYEYETGLYILKERIIKKGRKRFVTRFGKLTDEDRYSRNYNNLPKELSSTKISKLISKAHEKCFNDNVKEAEKRLYEIISGIYDYSTIAVAVSIKRKDKNKDIDFNALDDIGLLTIQEISLHHINEKKFTNTNDKGYLLNEVCRVKDPDKVIKGISPVGFVMKTAEQYIVDKSPIGTPSRLLVERFPKEGNPYKLIEIYIKYYGYNLQENLFEDMIYFYMRKQLDPRFTPSAEYLNAYAPIAVGEAREANEKALASGYTPPTELGAGAGASTGGKRKTKTRKNKKKSRKNKRKSRK